MAIIFESLVYDIIFVTCLLLGYLYTKLLRRLSYFDQHGVPSVKSLNPFSYNAAGLFEKKSIGDKLDELYVAFDGCKYGGYFQFFQPCLLLCDPDLIQKILKADFPYFTDHGLPVNPERNFLDDNIFFQSGGKWKALRRSMAPAFTSGKLRKMTPLIVDSIQNFTTHLNQKINSSFEVKDMLCKLTIDVIASCVFGIDSQSFQEEESQLKKMGKKVFHPPLSERLKTAVQFTSPKLFGLLKLQPQEKEIGDFFKSFVQDTFKYRKDNNVNRNDFIDLLLQLKEKGTLDMESEDKSEIDEEDTDHDAIETVKLEITDEILTAQSFLFFIAGHDTSASAMTFFLYLLAKNPDKQSKAREDVMKKKLKYGGLNYNAVKAMEYLGACISESLRIYPPITVLPRSCTKDYRMEDGFVVKKGTFIAIPILSLHRDPKYFPDPEKYIPERFLGDSKIHPGTYLPFGDGPRTCLAKRFALLEIQLTIAHILDRYEILPNPKMKEPITLKNQIFVAVADGGTWVNFKRLQSE